MSNIAAHQHTIPNESNGRAEVAVKSAKRALRDNVDIDGTLNTDKMVKALLAIRNTPHPGCKKSPAEIVFNRKLLGILPISPFRKTSKFDCIPSCVCIIHIFRSNMSNSLS